MGNRKFQKGDKVVIAPKFRDKFNEIQTVGEVLNVSSSGRARYLVKFEGKNFKSWYLSYELEHAPKSKNELGEQKPDKTGNVYAPKFRVGDKVFLTESAKRLFQERGLVVNNIHGKHIVQSVIKKEDVASKGKDVILYKLDDCLTFTFFDKDLQSEPGPDFKAGDRVIFTPKAKMWLQQNGCCDPNSSDYVDPEATYVISYKLGKQIILEGLDHIGASLDDLLHTGRKDPNKEYDGLKKSEYQGRLKSNWKEICNRYLKEFCERHGYKYEPDMWVGSDPGTIIEVSDMFVSMENIRYDVDNEVPVDYFSDWYWKSIELGELGVEHWMNYPSYCKGAPDEWTEERMNRLRESKKRLEEARESFRQTLAEEVSKSMSEIKEQSEN